MGTCTEAYWYSSKVFCLLRYSEQQAALSSYPIMIVIRAWSSGNSRTRISLVQIKLPAFSSSFQVTSNDKTPTVVGSALEKHNQDPKQASRYELIQLLPEGKGKDVLL